MEYIEKEVREARAEFVNFVGMLGFVILFAVALFK